MGIHVPDFQKWDNAMGIPVIVTFKKWEQIEDPHRTTTFLKSHTMHTVVLAIISYQAELHERYVTWADSSNVNFQNDQKTMTSAIKMNYGANRVETHGNHQVSIIYFFQFTFGIKIKIRKSVIDISFSFKNKINIITYKCKYLCIMSVT